MKIALIYDRVNKIGGAERVLTALHQLFPQAPLFTSVYNSSSTPWADNFRVIPSFIDKLPFAKKNHELFPWLTTLAFESFNLNAYDVVISITSAEAKSVITLPSTLHLCYCLTPTRYLWSHQDDYLKNPGLGNWSKLATPVFRRLKSSLQSRDLISSSRPDTYIAISRAIKTRINKYYQRNSLLLHPPVDYMQFSLPSKLHMKLHFSNYFLLVSRLTSYKQVQLAIKASNNLRFNLVVVGTGKDQSRLKSIAGSRVKFMGKVTEEELVWLYQNSKALIMPQEEDFGIVSLESQSAGKPVIAYGVGGAKDTIVNTQTGLFFKHQTVDSLTKAVKRFRLLSWNKNLIQTQAKKFDIKVFKIKFKQILEDQWQNNQ